MAIYHLEVKIIGRSEGRSAVAAAAYRSGDVLTNEWDGVTHDYSRKGWIEYSEIMLPDNAPREFMDRGTLWNAVEAAENNSNAQLAREVEVALPAELTLEQQIELVETYVRENFTSKGVCADFSIHCPPVRNDKNQPIDEDGNLTNDPAKMIFRNPHAHIMLTMRPMDENGQWEERYQKAYICKRGNKVKDIPCPMMERAAADGWRKQYRYNLDGTKVWKTDEEAAKLNLKRVYKHPLCRNIPNPTMQEWNSKEALLSWRKNWATLCNKTMEKLGIDARIDSRSYEAQGIDKIPSTHLGPAAYRMEKRNIETERGNFNRQVEEDNKFLQNFHETLEKFEQKEIERLNQTAAEMENYRSDYIVAAYQSLILSAAINKKKSEEQLQLEAMRTATQSIEQISNILDQLMNLLEHKQSEVRNLNPSQVQKKDQLENDISDIELQIQSTKRKMAELKEERKALQASYREPDQKLEQAQKLRLSELNSAEMEAAKRFYYLKTINKENFAELKTFIRENRSLFESRTKDSLKEYYKEEFDEDIYEQAHEGAPDMLADDTPDITKRRGRRLSA